MEPGSDRLRALVDTGSGSRSLVAAGNLADGDWHHVALTRSDESVVLYIDGAAVATAENLAGSTSAGAQRGVYVGQRPDGVNPLVGAVGEVYLYDRALSAEDVAALASDNGAAEGGQVLHLALEELIRGLPR
ncbi:hypothetical protein F7O44_09340 [Phytoactinopolyspora sp. XMNu-373]|uniref:Laminin G domain-containing protein n=1 Tax=Phytoactinopolyspora mesophila TaxID=2650750 RepID=A0A7K3M2Y1_9ACTN|nr:hypothetical protein [Phytoactinopolyspora mesophila]